MRKIRNLSTLGLLLLFGLLSQAQDGPISGKITDDKGTPIPFATIKIKGGKNATSADQKGEFQLTATSGSIVLVSAAGYTSQEVKVQGRQLIVALKNRDNLQEVVVTASRDQPVSRR